jgi:hypothetical protein
MNDDDYLSTLKKISRELDYLDTTLEILKAAHVLAEADFDDIEPKTNLLRVSLLIETYIARIDCPFEEMRITLKDEFTRLALAKVKCCSSSKSSATA